MTLRAINFEVQLTEINCGECGGTYAINERYRAQQYIKGGSWNCPYCQVGWGYSNDNENSKLKKELELEKKRTEWARQDAENANRRATSAEHRERAQKGAKTRLKNRVANGICPCCNRTFKNLASHMKSKHPEQLTTNQDK